MFRSRLERFIIKRSLVLTAVMATAALIFPNGSRLPALTGLIAGSVLSVFRFAVNAAAYGRICGTAPDGKDAARGENRAISGVPIIMLNQLLLLPLLYICYILGNAPFIGFTAGVLIVPAVVMINSITEAFGITKNNFE